MKPGNPRMEGRREGREGRTDGREGGTGGKDGWEGGRDGRDVLEIMKWVHMAWNGCIIGNTSEAG